ARTNHASSIEVIRHCNTRDAKGTCCPKKPKRVGQLLPPRSLRQARHPAVLAPGIASSIASVNLRGAKSHCWRNRFRRTAGFFALQRAERAKTFAALLDVAHQTGARQQAAAGVVQSPVLRPENIEI
ncbi:MAG TPA: hypothetical protein PLR78_15885, partial [Polaromonas sp.]|uniref:hypothetical protein n=1 Tax=Polaromonas sp. TaxID=1869339 RepID=UPI002CEBCBAE